MKSSLECRELDEDQVRRAKPDRCPGAPIPFARTSAFAPFVSFLDTIGAPTDRWLRQTGIPASVLNDAEALVPVYSAYRFAELAVRQEHLEDLGMIVGQRTSSFELGTFGKTLQGVSTVHDYLQTGIRLMAALSSGARLWLTSEHDTLRVNQYLKGPPGLGRCVADIYTLVVTINTLRRLIGSKWCPGEIRLLAGDEALLGNREVFGDSRLITGQRHSSFTVSRSLTRLPIRAENAGVAQVDAGVPAVGAPMPEDFIGSIGQLIASLAAEGYPDIETAAEAAGMSTRTLQRRLAGAGTSYSALSGAIRMHLAREWLAVTDMPVTDIAAALGYTDASNFARAFRRESSMSPRTYRQTRAPG